MPAIMPCPNTKCDFPGPMGFGDPKPWGTHFYHNSKCPGAWLFDENWYDDQADAYKAYKKDNPRLEETWIAAFDALIIEKNQAKYNRLIQIWRDELD